MTFPLKCRYVKLSFKTDVCLAIPWPMFPSHGTKQTAAYRIYPQTSLHLFSGPRIPQARCRCKPKWPVACGREDKGGHKAQEHPEVRTVNQIAQVQFCPSAGPLLHRNLAISPNSGRKKVVWQRCWEVWKFQNPNMGSCSTGKHTHTHKKKEIWKIIFLIFFFGS